MPENHLLEAALRYASQGFQVFPMHNPVEGRCSCGKYTCKDVGKHPCIRGGFNSASVSQKKIHAWWAKYPSANIGIATGHTSDLLVVDIDKKYGGDQTFEQLLSDVGASWPETYAVITGGGMHLWFRCPVMDIISGTHMLGRGVDIRCEGGCVVAPPSLHSSGVQYQPVDMDARIADAPEWLVEQLRASQLRKSIDGYTGLVPVGSRNTYLASEAGKLRASGLSQEDIVSELMRLNRNCEPTLEWEEVQQIARSISRYAPGSSLRPPSGSSQPENPLYWLPFSTRNWLESLNVACMDAEQRGWYITLMVYAWPHGGRLPADLNILARVAQAGSVQHFQEHCGPVLAEFEEEESNGKLWLVHRWLAVERAKRMESWDQKKAAGAASAAKRKALKGSGEGSDD